jgi:hypothetical protein
MSTSEEIRRVLETQKEHLNYIQSLGASEEDISVAVKQMIRVFVRTLATAEIAMRRTEARPESKIFTSGRWLGEFLNLQIVCAQNMEDSSNTESEMTSMWKA